MEVYLVGGAVRDELMGRPVHERDWVVVGGSPEALISAGYQPVGKGFPVFLHPTTHEEYALARTERKTAAGYHGFQFYAAPEVTLEDDLRRRDLGGGEWFRAKPMVVPCLWRDRDNHGDGDHRESFFSERLGFR